MVVATWSITALSSFDGCAKKAWDEYQEWLSMDTGSRAVKKLAAYIAERGSIHTASTMSNSMTERLLCNELHTTIPHFILRQLPSEFTTVAVLSTTMVAVLPTEAHAREAMLTHV